MWHTQKRIVESTQEAEMQREAIKAEFKWAWQAYEAHAMGHDELLPLSHGYRDWAPGAPLGMTILDSLDSLLLMGLREEYRSALDWVNTSLSFDQDAEVSTFEMTIRALGGLLSAHALTREPLFLSKATDLGDRLLRSFDTPTGLPTPKVNLRRGPVTPAPGEMLVLSEVGTLQLEFSALSDVTGDAKYRRAVDAVSEKLSKQAPGYPQPHLGPILLHPTDGTPQIGAMASMGAGGDSYYEYLLKAWLQTGRTEPKRRKRYALAAQAIGRSLVQRTPRAGSAFLAELSPFGGVYPKQDHLACFAPGMLALGGHTGAVKAAVKHLTLASELLETCCALYAGTPTGLAAEIVSEFDLRHPYMNGPIAWAHRGRHRDRDRDPENHGTGDGGGGIEEAPAEFRSAARDQHSLLRPETVESLFIMWRITHEPRWREQGWTIFEALRRHARLADGGYASIESVYDVPVRHRDHMESFWMAETLKYLYLLFSDDDVLSLDDWVFNTEAHPLPVQQQV